ncbi:putative Zinc finger, UBP-type, Zinc finger, RING/FYVE/PHD-type [Rosa chinensis]|uniref:Putative Zinc finger, UBP-type, Zinc finger, RING/FYVE/PHD-type n=1 Tax=Rosa chinensis TaxID=74649 RepID=A0A2P6Q272_ROSCH|nr:putative Zinc finger, UBP-type, Zinc finger, RING/FYVE/PHD-type [Rosa chinensis]
MSSKREHEDNGGGGIEGEGSLLEAKRQKVSEEVSPDSSPPASLLPGFNYGDEDEEERRAPVNGGGDGKELQAGKNGVRVEEEEEEDDGEQGLYQGHKSREIEVRRDCPYLDAVNRQVLDFDFEKFCSLSLSNLNVYACLVCGKYYQGRGRKSHAYTHSLEAGHHVYINLRTEKVYCLPDGYEISDPSLDDIRHVLNPRFTYFGVLFVLPPSLSLASCLSFTLCLISGKCVQTCILSR